MKKNQTAVSMISLTSIEALSKYLAEAGTDTRFEFAYTMSSDFLDQIEPLVQGKILSVHACCPSTQYFPNLGSSDPRVIGQSFADMYQTLETACRFGASIVVLHARYATDLAMPSSFSARSIVLAPPEFRADIAFEDGAICGPEYNRKESYQQFAAVAKHNLIDLAYLFASKRVRLAVENLNPRVGYLFHTPSEMTELAKLDTDLYLCLDIGHLFISSIAYGFDFLDGVREIVATNKVITAHLHSNSSGPGRFRDDHHSIAQHSFPIETVLQILAKSTANLVIETVDDPIQNTILLQDLLENLTGGKAP